MGFWFPSVFPILSFRSSLHSSLYISILGQQKNHEKILDNSTLQYLSLSARIGLIAILVMEIRKSQGDASVLFGTWNSFCCALILTKLTIEFGKVFYKEAVDNFISFPTV